MKSKTIYIIFLLFLTMYVMAQEKGDSLALDHLTLDNAINYSLKNSPEITIKILQQQQDEQKLSQMMRAKIPDIYISGDLRRNLIIPTTPIPAFIINSDADPNQILFMKFNTEWNSAAGINLSYDIFNPATFNQVKEQKLQNKMSGYETQISENEIRANIAQAYAGCVIAQAQFESVKEDTTYYYYALHEAKDLYSKEKISLTDKNNAVISYNTSVIKFIQAVRVYNEQKANMLYLLGKDVSEKNIETLHLSEDIPSLYTKMNDAIPQQISDTINYGLSFSRQGEAIYLAENRIKSANLKYLPTLSVNGFYGTNYYSNDFNLSDENSWHGNSYVALSLKIPVTRAFSTSKEISQLKLQEQIERENLRKIQNEKNKEWADALAKLTESEKEYEMNRQNYELSLQNVKASQAQFDKGYILNKDLLSEQMKCRNAYQNFLQSAYDVFINAINVMKIREE